MANWIAKARSNYVHITDIVGLVASLHAFPQIRIVADPTNATRMCFLVREDADGGWPTVSFDVDAHETEFDVSKHICPFLEVGQVLIMMEIGYEQLSALSGFAVAYTNKGERCAVNLQSIYETAALAFKDFTVRSGLTVNAK